MKNHFLFLVFEDPLVVGTLRFLMEALNNIRPDSQPHLTIQGPYDEKVSQEKVKRISLVLQNDVFFIGNPGVFHTKRDSTLYLSVKSDHLRTFWHKPDYPVEEFGFNPHISIYQGGDRPKVERALSFLKKHRVEMLCRHVSVTQYVSKQSDMFPQRHVNADENAISKLMNSGKLSSNFRASFLNAINSEHTR